MKVLISSRFKNYDKWPVIKTELEGFGFECITPTDIDRKLHGERDSEVTGQQYLESVREYHRLIKEADILYVLNFDGIVGASMMLEIGYAAALGKNIYCLEAYDSEPSLANFVTKIAKPAEFRSIYAKSNRIS